MKASIRRVGGGGTEAERDEEKEEGVKERRKEIY